MAPCATEEGTRSVSKEFQLALESEHSAGFEEGYNVCVTEIGNKVKEIQEEMESKWNDKCIAFIEKLIDCGDNSLSKLTSVSNLSEDKVREIARRKGIELIG